MNFLLLECVHYLTLTIYELYDKAAFILTSNKGPGEWGKFLGDPTLTTEEGITRSMSRVGKCIDNAPIESFFGHFKCESYDLKKYTSYEALVEVIDRYMRFYNEERYQQKLNNLAPIEYRY